MCPSIPSSVQDAARFGAPCPQNSTPAAGFFLLLGALRLSSLNRTILECADWGQITVSYTVLPLRRRSVAAPSAAVSGVFATPKKHRQINLLAAIGGASGGVAAHVIAPAARHLGEAAQEAWTRRQRISCWLPIQRYARPWRGPVGLARRHRAIGVLRVRREVGEHRKAVGGRGPGLALGGLAEAKPWRALLDGDARGRLPMPRRRQLGLQRQRLAIGRRRHRLRQAPAKIARTLSNRRAPARPARWWLRRRPRRGGPSQRRRSTPARARRAPRRRWHRQ